MIIFNAKIISKGRVLFENGWVEVLNGKISNIGDGNPPLNDGSNHIDAKGKTLISGFIDAHTHIGIMEDGLDFEGDDCNEQSDPFTPQLRAIDGINPFDYCFKE